MDWFGDVYTLRLIGPGNQSVRGPDGKAIDTIGPADCTGFAPPPNRAILITADYDFKSVPPGTMKIEFLPAK